MYLKGRVKGGGGRQTKRSSICWSTPHMPQEMELGRANIRSRNLPSGLPSRCRGPNTWARNLLLSQAQFQGAAAEKENLGVELAPKWMSALQALPTIPQCQPYECQSEPWLLHWEKQQKAWTPVPMWETQKQLMVLASIWPNPGCCSHRGVNQQMTTSVCFFLSFYLSIYPSIYPSVCV